MCGPFTQRYTWAEVREFLSVIGAPLNLRPRFNIAPTTTIDVVRLDVEGQRELVRMRWGLVPGWWSKPLKYVPATFNARAETVAEKPMFWNAFKARRCIIPASGFYEWTGEKGAKVPHLFSAADGSPVLAFAGLWDRWKSPEGEEILSATIIVSGASAWMTPYHDRMPVLLMSEQFDAWLSGEAGPDALRPAAESALREWIVSARVNKTGQGADDPSLVEPVAA
ncbi:SOS response-associated peptidase [Lichenifustis flavocetrariae]|uniref:Abasic site processing protein n=1 Tax=Lichenifustis flavocetrariae TaxID=2949735 RepID=A0AA41Z2S5_9HYPH|nr:SOS response-associated peptidase [Lichenifustis flavocetrariae]MCW6513154.1 SOS response-associated peptidase [Lichenifustis flavocetrariae]